MTGPSAYPHLEVQPKRKRPFQFYLSTAIVMMLVAGGFVVPLLVDMWRAIPTGPDNEPLLAMVPIGLVLSGIYASIFLVPALFLDKWVRERKWRRVGLSVVIIVCVALYIAYTPLELPIP
jgi:hypothetical protein